MNRKLTTAFLIALLISGICTFLLSLKLHRPVQEVHKQSYVASSVPLEAGEALKEEKLILVDWPATFPLPGAVLQKKDVVGRTVLYPISAGEPILNRDLAVAGSGLTVKIPDGMRAIALKTDEVAGVAGFLFPGSHVDVLVTYRSEATPETVTATVLQDAVVIAAGSQVQPSPDGKPVTVNVVTLLMKPEDAERAALASTQGTIHFVLRNSGDRAQEKNMPVGLSELDPNAVVRPQQKPAAPGRPQVVKPRSTYSVETLNGDKSSSTTF